MPCRRDRRPRPRQTPARSLGRLAAIRRRPAFRRHRRRRQMPLRWSVDGRRCGNRTRQILFVYGRHVAWAFILGDVIVANSSRNRLPQPKPCVLNRTQVAVDRSLAIREKKMFRTARAARMASSNLRRLARSVSIGTQQIAVAVWQLLAAVVGPPIRGGRCSASTVTTGCRIGSRQLLIRDSRQFAQIGRRHRLRTAPHQKEQRLAAPSAGRMADDVAGTLRRRQRRLAWPAAPGYWPAGASIPWCTHAFAAGDSAANRRATDRARAEARPTVPAGRRRFAASSARKSIAACARPMASVDVS